MYVYAHTCMAVCLGSMLALVHQRPLSACVFDVQGYVFIGICVLVVLMAFAAFIEAIRTSVVISDPFHIGKISMHLFSLPYRSTLCAIDQCIVIYKYHIDVILPRHVSTFVPCCCDIIRRLLPWSSAHPPRVLCGYPHLCTTLRVQHVGVISSYIYIYQ